MDAKYLLAIAMAFCTWFAYDTGYEKAETEYALKIESMKLDHANQIIEAQNKEAKIYEQKTKELVARFNDDRERSAERMRQLERKLQASTDVDSLKRERDRAISLAVEGEELLHEGGRIIEALK